jgi:uncharacterized membrane protein (DUF2068 family)
MERPFGVTLLGLLSLISGALGVLKGLIWLGVGGLAAAGAALAFPVAGMFIGTLALVIGGLALLTGLFSLIFAWGAFALKPWAWSLGVTTHGFNLLWSLLVVLGPGLLRERFVTILISAIVVLYLTKPEIKRAFGKG